MIVALGNEGVSAPVAAATVENDERASKGGRAAEGEAAVEACVTTTKIRVLTPAAQMSGSAE